ncbi:MAG: exodeoxyribonuclease VII large subunit [Gammaproteobacteria bacterium]|nr:exodeoxyribonuclease VII large subunit [Gammaproteobacteria bacterium]
MSTPTRFENTPAAPRDVYTVSRLNRTAREILEGSFPLLWVEGEISNLSRPSSGHWYFSLKDAGAQVRCAMFRNRNMYMTTTPENGAQVLVRVQVSLYENRGDYQLIVEHLEAAGDGALRRAFELLKQRLEREGLFDAARKRPLPALPQRIGVVTSPHGAALRDVLSVLRRRYPSIPVLIYPTAVQGAGAAQEIAATVRLASARNECDVLIVARGGGSLEDLWAFNDEAVARAIHACAMPVVTGIGHETDFTIADFVADQRAPTPSVAAEMVSPNRAEWQRRLTQLTQRCNAWMSTKLADSKRNLHWLTTRLQHPAQRLARQAQRVDELELRLQRTQHSGLRNLQQRLHALRAQLWQHTPTHTIRARANHCAMLEQRLRSTLRDRLNTYKQRMMSTARALETVSPLATLGRGYAMVRQVPAGTVIQSYAQVQPGDSVEARLGQGRLVCTITETHEN